MATPDNRQVIVQPGSDVRRQRNRLKTKLSWLYSKHSFSFSRQWDPGNAHYGAVWFTDVTQIRTGEGWLWAAVILNAFNREVGTAQTLVDT